MGACIIEDIKGMSLWDILSWERPVITGSILSGILSILGFYCLMNYTMLTFLCRIFQLFLLCGMVTGFSGRCNLTSDDINRFVDQTVNSATSHVVEAIQATYRLVTWRDVRFSGMVTLASIVLGFIGNYLSDIAIILCCVVFSFSLPVLYKYKKKEIDDLIGKVRTTMDGYLGKVATKMDGVGLKRD